MKKRNIKVIAFDFGGVIQINSSGSIMGQIAAALNVPLDVFKNEYFKYNHLSNVDNMPWKNMVVQVADAFNASEKIKEKISDIVEIYSAKNVFNTELIELFPVFRQNGLKVAIFSNNTTQLRETLTENGIMELVDEVIISSEIGFQKPHEEAFEAMFQKIGAMPEEVIFIDDTPKSLEKAFDIGYVPILFENNEKLREDLGRLGIPV